MSQSEIQIKRIKNKLIKALCCQFLPLMILGFLDSYFKLDREKSLLDYLPQFFTGITALTIVILFFYGYFVACRSIYQYAKYKGYSKFLGFLAGLLNVFGMSFLFLLDNKNSVKKQDSNKNSLKNISFLSLIFGFFAISILFCPIFIIIIMYIGNVGLEQAFSYLNERNISTVLNLPLELIFAWYVFKELNKANINFQYLIGSIQKIDFKLPLILAITEFFFAWGFNSVTLYCLSFIVPKYVENQISQEYPTTYFGFFAFAVGAIIFAPIIEEILFRGILFQKIANERSVLLGTLISAFIFALAHVRYDVISLCLSGVIFVILYLKTKQLIIPILNHFFYNLIVTVKLFYHQFLEASDRDLPVTIAELQKEFIDNLELVIMFIVLSTPYLIYFIYKNFPRNYNIDKLPYFINQKN
jgi:uncharacterized protein